MPFIKEILKHKSLSIVGMHKNTGKTECLNYILGRLPRTLKTAVTSIGVDGESVDQVFGTSKPEIFLNEGMFFCTSEKHYAARRLVSEICEINPFRTSLGRTVTAKVIYSGTVLLSGPSSTAELDQWMSGLGKFGIGLTIVDGALSRMSSASPAVSESMVLTTGAALSSNLQTLISKTEFAVELIRLKECGQDEKAVLKDLESGIWTVDYENVPHKLEAKSSFVANDLSADEIKKAKTVYVTGALTDSFLKKIRLCSGKTKIVVRDFTRCFITPYEYRAFIWAGGKIEVLRRTDLLAICVNPVSPSGFSFNSDMLSSELGSRVGLPVYDLRKC